MSETVDFAKIIQDATDMQQRMIEIGRQVERERLLPHLQAIFNAYRKSLGDQKVTLSPELHLALANAQRLVGEIRNLQPARNYIGHDRPAWELDQQGAYDMSPRGGSLRPGS